MSKSTEYLYSLTRKDRSRPLLPDAIALDGETIRRKSFTGAHISGIPREVSNAQK